MEHSQRHWEVFIGCDGDPDGLVLVHIQLALPHSLHEGQGWRDLELDQLRAARHFGVQSLVWCPRGCIMTLVSNCSGKQERWEKLCQPLIDTNPWTSIVIMSKCIGGREQKVLKSSRSHPCDICTYLKLIWNRFSSHAYTRSPAYLESLVYKLLFKLDSIRDALVTGLWIKKRLTCPCEKDDRSE